MLACNDRVHRAVLGNPRDGQRERTMPARNVADILAAKQLAPASQHLPKPCGDRFGVHALRCAGVPARRKKIGTLADTESGACARGNKRAPGLVSHNDRRGCVEHTDFARQRIEGAQRDRKSTRLNSSHGYISYAVFCLKKKKKTTKKRSTYDTDVQVMTQSKRCELPHLHLHVSFIQLNAEELSPFSNKTYLYVHMLYL